MLHSVNDLRRRELNGFLLMERPTGRSRSNTSEFMTNIVSILAGDSL